MQKPDRSQAAPFVALDEYAFPSLPVVDGAYALWAKLGELFRRQEFKPLIRDDRLRAAPVDRLDEAAAPPACGPVVHELERHLASWLADTQPGTRLQVMVLPPCDQNNLVRQWARQKGLDMLEAPDRDRLMRPNPGPVDLEGEGVLVIPCLERWFVRATGGLDVVRELIAKVAGSDRKVLLGCNSWAWRYFSKSLNIEAVLPRPYTFAPFDTERLRQWFRQIARSHDGSSIRFIDPDSGDEILHE